MSRSALSSDAVTRRQTKPRKGELHNLHIRLDGGLLADIDAIAKEGARFGRTPTRTEIIHQLLSDAIEARKGGGK